jgi:penicillin-binding protein 1C
MKRLYIFLSISVGLLGMIFLILPKLEMPSCSPVLLDQSGEILCTHLSPDEQWRLPIRIEEVPPLYLKMLIAYEDKRFYSHPGVDPIALARGLWQWVKNGRIISGGSTLTMQTVRLMRPRPRTILYKIEEILQALRLEWTYSKEEILTIYLTLAPYGGNVQGLRAASLNYFQQDPMQLTPAKMALMVVIPQLPTVLRPHIYPQKAKLFRDKVLVRLKDKGIITADQCLEARNDPVPSSRAPFPMYAPHVMQNFRQRYPTQTVYQTTLIKKKQMALESLLRCETSLFESHQTAAALIIENGTRNIIAYVGSAYPFSEAKNGYVDMVLAIRSPGSALKPIIYALAFDENLIHPETLIEDVSTNFNGYMPTNFRDVFHGEVTVREALQQSLNIPVVHLLDRLGPGRFVDWLKHSGVTLYFSSKDRLPSLPIALGGVGIRLYDLATLYCALANGGQYAPLTLMPRSSPLKISPLIQPAASWYVTRILEDAPAPSGLVDWFVTEKSPVAFKTGTSYGARDALCIGYTTGANGYTAAVWTGRADGSPSPNQLGRKTAAPILLKIFNTILLTKGGFDSGSPPQGVMSVPASQLPEALRWFRHSHAVSSAFTKRPVSLSQNKGAVFQILSPQSNTTYVLQKKDSDDASFVPISLKLQGGKPPFLLLVNGEPRPINKIQEDARCDQQIALWHPTKIGFFELTLVDAEGHSDSVTIRMK